MLQLVIKRRPAHVRKPLRKVGKMRKHQGAPKKGKWKQKHWKSNMEGLTTWWCECQYTGGWSRQLYIFWRRWCHWWSSGWGELGQVSNFWDTTCIRLLFAFNFGYSNLFTTHNFISALHWEVEGMLLVNSPNCNRKYSLQKRPLLNLHPLQLHTCPCWRRASSREWAYYSVSTHAYRGP